MNFKVLLDLAREHKSSSMYTSSNWQLKIDKSTRKTCYKMTRAEIKQNSSSCMDWISKQLKYASEPQAQKAVMIRNKLSPVSH